MYPRISTIFAASAVAAAAVMAPLRVSIVDRRSVVSAPSTLATSSAVSKKGLSTALSLHGAHAGGASFGPVSPQWCSSTAARFGEPSRGPSFAPYSRGSSHFLEETCGPSSAIVNDASLTAATAPPSEPKGGAAEGNADPLVSCEADGPFKLSHIHSRGATMSGTTTVLESNREVASDAQAEKGTYLPPTPPNDASSPAGRSALVFSFKGSPSELQDRLRGANVLLFFHKTFCVPCATMRTKLLHAVTGADEKNTGVEASVVSSTNGTQTDPVDSAQIPSLRTIPQQLQHQDQASMEKLADGDAGPKAALLPTSEPTAATAAENSSSSASFPIMSIEDQRACHLASRSLGDVAKAFPDSFILLAVDTNENPTVTALHDIRSLPTFIAYRDGCIAGRVEGAEEEEILKLVHLLTKDAPKGGFVGGSKGG